MSIMGDTIHVVVQSLAGTVLTLHVECSSNVHHLKESISSAWTIPAEFQVLTFSSMVLQDDDDIAALCSPSMEVISITMVVSSTRVVKCLHDPQARLPALTVLAQFPFRDAALIPVVGACLEDALEAVRSRALEVLGRIVDKGNADAIDVIVARFEHPEYAVRKVAMRALMQVVDRGNRHAIDVVVARLGHPESHVRASAAEALVDLAEKGDTYSIDAVVGGLVHWSSSVRQEACVVLRQLGHGEAHAISMISRHMEDSSSCVRDAAVQALWHVADQGDERAVSELVSRLECEDVHIKASVIDALARVSATGDERVIGELLVCLEDASELVRVRSLQALAQVSYKGNKEVIRALSGRLDDCEELVTYAAQHALLRVAEKGNRDAITAVIPHLEDSHWKVRESALVAFMQLSIDEKEITKRASIFMADPDPRVRDVASMAMFNRDRLLELWHFRTRSFSGNSY